MIILDQTDVFCIIMNVQNLASSHDCIIVVIIGVVKMADLKNNISKSIRSARQWLAHAEDSFGNDRDVRGELDLILAQAELQRVREANRSGRWRSPYSLFSQGLALGLALFISVAGLGGAYWWVHAQKAVPVPLAVHNVTSTDKTSVNLTPIFPAPGVSEQLADKPNTKLREQLASEQSKVPTAVKAETVQNALAQQPQNVDSVVSQVASERERPTEKEVVLPPDEMQKLIREAGKSLRGQ